MGCHHGNLGELVLVGVRVGGTVGEDHHTVVTPLLVLEAHDEGAGNHGDTGQGLHDLEGGTEHIAGGVLCASDLAVNVLVLDEQGGQVERILDFLEGLFHRHTFVLADFVQHVGVEILLGVVHRVDDVSLRDVFQTPFGSFGLDGGLVAQKRDVGVAVFDDDVGSL